MEEKRVARLQEAQLVALLGELQEELQLEEVQRGEVQRGEARLDEPPAQVAREPVQEQGPVWVVELASVF